MSFKNYVNLSLFNYIVKICLIAIDSEHIIDNIYKLKFMSK